MSAKLEKPRYDGFPIAFPYATKERKSPSLRIDADVNCDVAVSSSVRGAQQPFALGDVGEEADD